jgi:hypothetical protein
MNRKEALLRMTLLMGGSMMGAQALLSACTSKTSPFQLNDGELALINELAETILPATESSGGAKQANVAVFIQAFIQYYYPAEQQERLKSGLGKLQSKAQEAYNRSFIDLTTEQREALLWDLEKETAASKDNEHYYGVFKELIIWAYFTSEAIVLKAFDYRPAPGVYVPDTPYAPGDKLEYPGMSLYRAGQFARVYKERTL